MTRVQRRLWPRQGGRGGSVGRAFFEKSSERVNLPRCNILRGQDGSDSKITEYRGEYCSFYNLSPPVFLPRPPSPSLAPSRFPSFFFRPPKFSNLKCHASSDRSHLCHANSSTVWIGCPRINFSRGIFWRAAFLSWQEQERRCFGWIWPSNDAFFFNGTRAKRKLTSFAVNRIIRRWNPFQAFYKKAQVWRNPLWKRGREEEKRNLGRASRSRKKKSFIFSKK